MLCLAHLIMETLEGAYFIIPFYGGDKGTERLRNLPRATELSARQGWDLEGAHATAHHRAGLPLWGPGVLGSWGARRWGGTPLAVPPLTTGHTPAGRGQSGRSSLTAALRTGTGSDADAEREAACLRAHGAEPSVGPCVPGPSCLPRPGAAGEPWSRPSPHAAGAPSPCRPRGGGEVVGPRTARKLPTPRQPPVNRFFGPAEAGL